MPRKEDSCEDDSYYQNISPSIPITITPGYSSGREPDSYELILLSDRNKRWRMWGMITCWL